MKLSLPNKKMVQGLLLMAAGALVVLSFTIFAALESQGLLELGAASLFSLSGGLLAAVIIAAVLISAMLLYLGVDQYFKGVKDLETQAEQEFAFAGDSDLKAQAALNAKPPAFSAKSAPSKEDVPSSYTPLTKEQITEWESTAVHYEYDGRPMTQLVAQKLVAPVSGSGGQALIVSLDEDEDLRASPDYIPKLNAMLERQRENAALLRERAFSLRPQNASSKITPARASQLSSSELPQVRSWLSLAVNFVMRRLCSGVSRVEVEGQCVTAALKRTTAADYWANSSAAKPHLNHLSEKTESARVEAASAEKKGARRPELSAEPQETAGRVSSIGI